MTTQVTGFDPRMLPGGEDLLPGVRADARRHLMAAALALMALHPEATRADIARLADRLWHAVRADVLDDGATVEAALSAADSTRQVIRLGELLGALISAGDLRRTLEAKRAEIDRALTALPPER